MAEFVKTLVSDEELSNVVGGVTFNKEVAKKVAINAGTGVLAFGAGILSGAAASYLGYGIKTKDWKLKGLKKPAVVNQTETETESVIEKVTTKENGENVQ